jgi:hypothetical protein
MNSPPISDQDKLKCIEREIFLRLRVYPGLIRKGTMTSAGAEREIALMESIRDDYRAKMQPSLLDTG